MDELLNDLAAVLARHRATLGVVNGPEGPTVAVELGARGLALGDYVDDRVLRMHASREAR
jgi:hypothetical protein